jgi:hypothetical protein
MLIRFFILLCCLSLPAYAQECLSDAVETTPDEDFSLISDDEVLHEPTGLIWQRCSQGQTWDGTTCSGQAIQYSWQQALALAQQTDDELLVGWRLPNLKELASLTEKNCVRPAINTTWFPNTPADDFWSSTPSLTDPKRSWLVAFFNSSYSIREKSLFVYVRLVRTYEE